MHTNKTIEVNRDTQSVIEKTDNIQTTPKEKIIDSSYAQRKEKLKSEHQALDSKRADIRQKL